MDRNVSMQSVKNRLSEAVKKLGIYKYAALILLLGIVLMLVPAKKGDTAAQELQTAPEEDEDLTQQLEEMLALIDGAGRVRVLLTRETGRLTEYQTDLQTDDTGEGSRQETETVLVSTGGGTEEALIRKTVCPLYRGAVVLCDGAERAAVRLNIVQAVASLTGLGSDKITVIKMRGN